MYINKYSGKMVEYFVITNEIIINEYIRLIAKGVTCTINKLYKKL